MRGQLMPSREPELIARCPICRVRVVVDETGLTPKYRQARCLYTDCQGSGRKAIDFEHVEQAKTRRAS